MHRYQHFFRIYFQNRLLTHRRAHRHTQETMAEHLQIKPRSYASLERGICSCSACTLLFFLLQLSPTETRSFLEDFRSLVEKEAKYEAA